MLYGVILSVDAEKDFFESFRPAPASEDAWAETEDESSEYDFWYEDEEGWHKKWVALLDEKQLEALMVQFDWIYIGRTMGAIGMPCPDPEKWYMHWPAFSISNNDQDIVANAYITPYFMEGDEDVIPEFDLRNTPQEEGIDWEVHEDKIIDWFKEKWELI